MKKIEIDIVGFILEQRFIQLLVELEVLTREEYSLYRSLIRESHWQNPHMKDFGTISGTREELKNEYFKDISRVTFYKRFNKILKVGLLEKISHRVWRVKNFFLHLAVKKWPKDFKKYEATIPAFYKFLDKKLKNTEEEITDSIIIEVRENLILFLTDEKFFKSFHSPNKQKEQKNLTMNKEGWGNVGEEHYSFSKNS